MKAIATDGNITQQINDSWDFADVFKNQDVGFSELYAKVAACYTAVNRIGRAVSSIPYTIYKGDEVFDVSTKWENKIGFIPNPKDLFRRLQQSITFTNMGYLRMGKNIAGHPKNLHYVLPDSIEIIVDTKGDLIKLVRSVNGIPVESFPADDPNLIRFWYLDHTTELLPSDNTEFQAIAQSAGIMYYSDMFTRAYFQRGGIKPTLIAMKGLVSSEKAADMEKGWTKFIRGIGRAYNAITTKVFNAEAMDIKPFGDGLGDLGDNAVYRQSIENISIGLDMPLSILLSNAANYATAQGDQRLWYDVSIIPRAEFLTGVLNDQLLLKMGLRMEITPEAIDVDRDEEVNRTDAYVRFGESLNVYPSFELWQEAANTFGFDLTDGLIAAAQKYYNGKGAKPEQKNETPLEIKPEEPEPAPVPEIKSVPDIRVDVDTLEELRIWREVSARRWKKGATLDYPYKPHGRSIPNTLAETVMERLAALESRRKSITEADIANVFIFESTVNPESDALTLAAALNNHARALLNTHDDHTR